MTNSIKFDRDQVIDKAQRLFWQRGFNGTSMRELLQTVNLRPGSLYASFGDKETLYHNALLRYAAQGQQFLAQCQADTATPIAALQQFVRLQVLHAEQAPSQVCMLVKTVAELSAEGSKLALLAKIFWPRWSWHFANCCSRRKCKVCIYPHLQSGSVKCYRRKLLA
ncbi:TetR/AcrR family transcriptional regulator [Rheinheimera baltica]|uniref:TetR/AcrR family transcriptional regulator n=1 Tax=Rheinheimera baltica TaxID=67576 RepID=UPI0027400200|nr:TetR/AcrR family transcriptional regulator [Rheinheimera baltica]MDP5149444.1 TetR/AcrR family transcriptional regulator [Rheinheimera baltica]